MGVLGLMRLLSLLLLVLLIRAVAYPLDMRFGEGELASVSLLAPMVGLLLLYSLEVMTDRHVEFGIEEFLEGATVVAFGAVPLGWAIPAIMLTAMLAGWVSHISGKRVI